MTRTNAVPVGRVLLPVLVGLLGAWGCVRFDTEEEAYCQRNPATCGTPSSDAGTTPPAPVERVSARGQFSLALRSDGSVWAWGQNEKGQLGDADASVHKSPIRVNPLGGVSQVAAGFSHSLALRAGKVWFWGERASGAVQLPPVEVSGLSGITAIAAGNAHSLALDPSKSVWIWGRHGATINGDTPRLVEGLPRIQAIAAGNAHSLALGEDGSVWAWGNNELGQLGVDTPLESDTPVKVAGLPATIEFIAGGGGHSLARDSTGAVWAWGNNNHGQLGDGTIGGKRSTPERVAGVSDITDVAAGYEHSLALTRDNDIQAWGRDSAGQLGNDAEQYNPTSQDRALPVKTYGLTRVTSLSAGYSHSLAILNGGLLFAWGSNQGERLGVGQAGDTIGTPRPVTFLP